MTEHRYQIQVSTQLGMRRGTLTWTEQGSALQGTLHFLHRADPDPCLPHFLSGRLRSGRQRPDGHFPHGIRRLLHRRGSVRAGKHPQRRNDLSPLSALLWQNHRCFTLPKSRKSFFLQQKAPRLLLQKPRGFDAFLVLFIRTLSSPHAITCGGS